MALVEEEKRESTTRLKEEEEKDFSYSLSSASSFFQCCYKQISFVNPCACMGHFPCKMFLGMIENYRKQVRAIQREKQKNGAVSVKSTERLSQRNQILWSSYLNSGCEEKEYKIEVNRMRCERRTRKRLICQRWRAEKEEHQREMERAIMRIGISERKKGSEGWEPEEANNNNNNNNKWKKKKMSSQEQQQKEHSWWKQDIESSQKLWKVFHCLEIVVDTKQRKVCEITCFGKHKQKGLMIFWKVMQDAQDQQSEEEEEEKEQEEREEKSILLMHKIHNLLTLWMQRK